MAYASFRSVTAAACAGAALSLAACSGAPLEADATGANEAPTRTIAYIDIAQSRSVDVEHLRAELGADAVEEPEALPEGDAASAAESARHAHEVPDEVSGGTAPPEVDNHTAGHAIAHFVEAPSTHTTALELVGLAPAIPKIGQCQRRNQLSKTPLSSMPELRLLDAGEVNIHADAARADLELSVSLAPRAFPSVSSFVSGVMYTSRDRSTRLLAATQYTVEVTGGKRVPPLSFTAHAPHELSNLTLGGLPVDQVERVSTNGPIDLTWDVGSKGDVVYVELENAGSEPSIRCAFADETGTATIPSTELSGLKGNGRLSVHRLRVVRQDFEIADPHEALRHAEIRFNFEVTRSVHFSE